MTETPKTFKPPTCSHCGDALETVHHDDFATWYFDELEGKYKDNGQGSGEVKCGNCGADVYDDLDGTPAEYQAEDPEEEKEEETIFHSKMFPDLKFNQPKEVKSE